MTHRNAYGGGNGNGSCWTKIDFFCWNTWPHQRRKIAFISLNVRFYLFLWIWWSVTMERPVTQRTGSHLDENQSQKSAVCTNSRRKTRIKKCRAYSQWHVTLLSHVEVSLAFIVMKWFCLWKIYEMRISAENTIWKYREVMRENTRWWCKEVKRENTRWEYEIKIDNIIREMNLNRWD